MALVLVAERGRRVEKDRKPEPPPLVRVEEGWPSPFPSWVPDWLTGTIIAFSFLALLGFMLLHVFEKLEGK